MSNRDLMLTRRSKEPDRVRADGRGAALTVRVLLTLTLALAGPGATFGAARRPAAAAPKDDPLLPRYPGAVVVASDRRDHGDVRMPLERVVFDLQSQKFNPYRTAAAQGTVIQTLYELPAGTGTAAALKFFGDTFAQANAQVLFSGAGDALDNGNDRFVDQIYKTRVPARIYDALPLNRDTAYMAARGERDGATWYAHIYLFANTEGRATNLIKKGRVGALVETVRTPATPAASVAPSTAVTSAQMASEINRTGRIALYGIFFDTNRTEIKPESRPTLEQIADLLKRETDLKLLVVGHTDNVGDFESNRDLSQRRATSVVNALVTGFGIAPERLVAFGVSYASPVASNGTAEGRSQNRRVELVRY